jgi:hypothetical protein
MRKWVLIGGVVVLAGLLWFFLTAPTFTIIKPFVAPASPSGLAVTRASPAPRASFPLEVQVDGHGHATRNITVTMELLTSPTATPVTFNASNGAVNGNTITATAARPNQYAFVNSDMVKMTWSGQYYLGPGLWFPFSAKPTTVRFPAFIVTAPTIPSGGSGTVKIQLTPLLDFPVTIDLAGNGVTPSSSSVTIAAGQTTPSNVTVSAPVVNCPMNPVWVEGGTCIGGSLDLTSKFGGTAIIVAQRTCVPIRCP